MDGNNRWTALLVVVGFLLIMCRCCLADFAEVPSSVTINVSENQNALFRCRHERLDAIITWFINGTISNRYSDVIASSISESDGTFVDTLTIPATPVYNGTEVVCVATFIDGSPSERTPPVTLTITEYSQVTTTPEPAPPPPGTTEPTGTFEITPSPLTVAVEQEVATFYCQHTSSDVIAWLVNGTSLNRIDSPNITISSSGRIRLLSIRNLLEYDGTTVQCVATFLDGSPPLPTPPVVLLTQDTPGKVKNATCERNDSTDANTTKADLTTRWSSLPSLDLNDTDPDIMYSVELYKITCGEDIFMSREDVFVNSTNNTVDPMQIYKVIITARNNVEGARNGTSVEMREKFMTLNKASLFQLTQNSQFNTKNNTPVPSYYTMKLEPLDGHQEQNLMINISVERSGEMVNMSVDGEIPTKTLWSASLLAYGCQSDTVVKGAELSTHEIQNISVNNSSQPGQVRVTGSFIDDSTATGLLVIVIGDSEVIYHKASRDGTDKIKETLITGLAGGNYSISVFVVEENGLPFERVATSPKPVTVETNDSVTPPSSSIEYSLQSTSTGVCITCTFLNSSATDCVAVVHQQISQLNSSGLMNIESSHKLTRSGDTASGCIEGVNMEDYQVGVVEERPEIFVSDLEKSSCAVCVSVGSVTVIMSVLASVVLVLIILVSIRSKRRKGHSRVHNRNGSPTDNDTESGHGNEYEKCPLDNKEEVTGETESTPPPSYSKIVLPEREVESTVGHQQTSAPVVPHRAHTVDRSQPVYVDALSTQVNVVAAPPVVERQEYDQVTGFKNPEGLHYAIVGRTTKSQKTPLDNDIRERVVYSKLMPQVSQDVVVDDSNEKDNHPQLDTPTSTPFTSSNLLSLLHPVVSKWKQLAVALSVDENGIDDIFTNNETDEACLCDLLDRFIVVHHNWADVERALRKMGEKHLAERASKLYVLPNPVQPEMTDHLGPKVIVHNSVYQPVDKSSEVFPAYCTEDNVSGNVSDIRSLNGTSTSVTGLTLKSADPDYGSRHSSEEAGESFYQRLFFEPAAPLTDCCQRFFTQLGTDEPQQQNTQSLQSDIFYQQPICETATCLTNCRQGLFTPLGIEEPQQQNTHSVQSEHDDNPYMSAVMSSLKVSHHVQMPKEEQQRLLHCKPVSRYGLWQEKASLLSQDEKGRSLHVHEWLANLKVSVVNGVHHLQEWLSNVQVYPASTLNSDVQASPASTLNSEQGWLSNLQESVVSFASLQLSQLKIFI